MGVEGRSGPVVNPLEGTMPGESIPLFFNHDVAFPVICVPWEEGVP